MRLRLGRLAWELYYTRTRAVLPRDEVRRRAALLCGHLGYVTGMLEYIMTDMVWLRVYATAGCVLIVGFQVAQPKIQVLSASWNSIFAIVNVYQIYWLVRRLTPMTEEEAGLYNMLGGEEKLPQRRFQELLEIGTWKFMNSGEKLAEEGKTAEEPEVCLLASGSCDVLLNGLVVGRLGPGSVVGEVWALAPDGEQQPQYGAGNGAGATVEISGGDGARLFCTTLDRLKNLPEVHAALYGVFATALADKVLSMRQQARLQQYAAVLEVACGAGTDPAPAVLSAVADFRQRHGVTEEEHFRAVRALPRCGSSRLLRPLTAM